jgi:thiol-disulfide isomerase/thioredoxin
VGLVGCSRPAASRPADGILLGEVSDRDILAISDDWRRGFESARPDVHRLRDLLRAKPELSAVVVFGSWCGDSRAHVPEFLKIRELLGKKLLPTTFLGTDPTKKEPVAKIAPWRIERVPTFVILQKGKEIGRIVETPAVSLPADLAEILARAK